MGLIKKIADGICKLLAMQGIIQKEDLELYRYGIENGIIVVLNFLTSVVIGIITGRLGVVLVLSVFLCAASHLWGRSSPEKQMAVLSAFQSDLTDTYLYL